MQEVERWITEAVVRNPVALSTELAEHFKVSRASAATALRKLTTNGWLVRHGTTRPFYTLGAKRRISRVYKLEGLDEHLAWDQNFAPFIDAAQNIRNICHHGLTEMLNNAIDHSAGSLVYVSIWQDELNVSIVIADNGIGIFERIRSSLALPDLRLALLELSKGKLTTDPDRHTGEGIFFTSRMFDRFIIEANGLRYTHDTNSTHDWLLEKEQFESDDGTWLHMSIPLASARTTKEVFDSFTSGPDDFSFDKTVVPVRLARLGNENLISRSQAKRLITRFERFRTVILDFRDVPEIGQAFADELFRVFTNAHPEVKLIPMDTAPPVEQMIKRATAGN